MISPMTHGYLRPSVDDLESHLLASRRVRDFLKGFSATQWPRVLKAAVILGIQQCEKRGGDYAAGLSAKDLEDMVVANEQEFEKPTKRKHKK
jgi:hypothetical protein